MERPVELKAPAWIKRIGDLETIVEITTRLCFAYDHEGFMVEDSRSIIWVAEDIHDLFLRIHNSEDQGYWDDRCFLEHLDGLVGKFFECMKSEPTWITTDHHSMYGRQTVEDLLRRHGYLTVDVPVRLTQ
jgi:hypothetical protein